MHATRELIRVYEKFLLARVNILSYLHWTLQIMLHLHCAFSLSAIKFLLLVILE